MAMVPIPHVQTFRARGKTYHYYRRHPVRVRLTGAPGSAEWQAAYEQAEVSWHAARAGAAPRPGRPAHAPGTIGALIASYRATTGWAGLAEATRRDYEKGLGWLEARHARGPVATMQRPQVIRLRELAAWKLDAKTGEKTIVPSRANKMLAVLSILMEHARDLGWRRDNPVTGVAKVATDGEGYRPWAPAEIAAFLRTSDEFWALALTLALCTGQRGQDVVRMGWSAYDGAAIEVVQEKTGAKAWLPVHPDLKALLDATPRTGLFLLMRPDRRLQKKGQPARPPKPWPVNAFQKAAGDAIAAAGLSGVVWHGLRATAASYLAEGGSSDAEIMAITGHRTAKMAQHYRRGAQQKTLATAAVGKMRMRHET